MLEEDDGKTITRERLTGPRMSMSLGEIDVYRPRRLVVIRDLAVRYRLVLALVVAHVAAIATVHAVITLFVAGIMQPGAGPSQPTGLIVTNLPPPSQN